jgi:hypothetical protein
MTDSEIGFFSQKLLKDLAFLRRTYQWRLQAIAVGPSDPTGFDETSRILL